MTTFPATRRAFAAALNLPVVGSLLCVGGLFLAGVPYIYLRAAADSWRAPVNGAHVEARLFGGSPNVGLQNLLFSGHYGLLERAAVYVHASWFLIPPLVTLFIVFADRKRFRSYAVWHLLVMYLAIIGFVLLPMRPPWMADSHVTRILAMHWGAGVVKVDDNPVAAMPSLHVALPLTLSIWAATHRHPRLAAFLGLYSAAIAFCVVFLGEHYVLDILGAVALVALVGAIGVAGEQWLSSPLRVRRVRTSFALPQRASGQRAQGILEFALIAPFLLIFIFVIVDFGIGINRRVIVTNAAREAARYAATGQSVSAIQQRAVQQANGLIKTSDVQVKFYDVDSNPGLNPGDSVAVKINYSYTWLSPIRAFSSALPTSLEMNACTDMRMEEVPVGATPEASGVSPCQ